MNILSKPALLGACLLALGLSCTAAVSTQATPDTPPPPPAQDKGHGPNKEGRHERRGDRLEAMARHLNLTEAQKIQIKPLMQEQFRAMKAIRDDNTLSPEQRHTKIKAARDEYRPKIRAVLTPEQAAKLEEWEKKGREQAGRGPTPPPPPPADQPAS